MRQGTRGFYAVQGGAHRVNSEQPIEIWVEGSVSTGVTPRLIIDWGDGSDDHTGCGSWKLFHSYSTLEIPGVASVGTWASPASHHVGFAALVIIGVPGPVYETCVAAAEDQTVTSNRTFLIQ